MIVGAGLAVGGIASVWSGRKQRDVAWITWDDWLRRPRLVLKAGLVIAAVMVYALVVDTVGFFLTAFVFLAVLLLAFGVRPRWVAPLAGGTTVGLHIVFYTFLRVQLPWGWLEGLAW